MHGLSPVPPAPKQKIDIGNDVPAYRVTVKQGFLDENDKLWPQDSLLYWEGEPNMGLEPVNQIAWDKMNAYLEEREEMGNAAAEKKGYQGMRMMNQFNARTKKNELDRLQKRMIGAEPEIQILGNKNKKGQAAQLIGTTATVAANVASLGSPKKAAPEAKPTANKNAEI